MPKVLVVMMAPPGSAGVMGNRYNKLLPYWNSLGWDFHFVGPDPNLSSVLVEPVAAESSSLHFSQQISWSTRFSVRKHRSKAGSLRFYLFGLLQFMSRVAERLLGHDANAFLLSGIELATRKAVAEIDFDLIAGKSPEFAVTRLVASIAHSIGKPFVAIADDPHATRTETAFVPREPAIQRRVMEMSAGVIFMSPLTRQSYIDCGIVDPGKAYALTDSFPLDLDFYRRPPGSSSAVAASQSEQSVSALRMLHLGMLPEWRPIDPLLDVLETDPVEILLDFYGYLYPGAQKRIACSQRLSDVVRWHGPVSHRCSHSLADQADVLLVVIGPRHRDNQPSKFFEYLGHGKPMLVIGPLGNPIQEIVERLGIGCYAEVSDPVALRHAVDSIVDDYSVYLNSYNLNRDLISAYGADKVAVRWLETLKQILSNDSF